MKKHLHLFWLKKGGSLEKLTDISEKEFPGNEREEIQKVTRKNFEKIFPKRYILITKNSEYTTRKGTRIDDVAFDEKDKTFLVFEYKSKKDKGHFEQARSYLATLSYSAEQERLLREVERITGKRLESRNIKWFEMKPVCVSSAFDERQYLSSEWEDRIKNNESYLVRVIKYRDERYNKKFGDIMCFWSENEILFTEQKKVKGVEKKERKSTIDEKTQSQFLTHPSVGDKKENGTKNVESEKSELGRFLEKKKVSEWVESKIKELDEKIRKKFGEGKVISKDFFVYKKAKDNLISILPRTKKQEFSVFLKRLEEQETIGGNWQLITKGKGRSNTWSFDWRVIIKDEKYKNFKKEIEKYLEEAKKKNLVKKSKQNSEK